MEFALYEDIILVTGRCWLCMTFNQFSTHCSKSYDLEGLYVQAIAGKEWQFILEIQLILMKNIYCNDSNKP